MKKSDDQGKFLKRLGDLLQKGYTFMEAIDFLLVPKEKKTIKLKRRLVASLQKGESISTVMSKQLNLPNHVSAQIFFAEHHGQMGHTLSEAGTYLIKRRKNQQQLQKVFQYPLMLIFISIIMMVLLRKVLFPRFQSLYSSMGYEPSAKLTHLLHFIENFPMVLGVVFFILLFSTILFFLFKKRISPQKLSAALSRLPILSFYIKLGHSYFFSRELSFLLSSGVSITESLLIIESQSFRPTLQYISGQLIQKLKAGIPFHECFASLPFFQEELPFIVQHGQTNGRLAEELRVYSDICFQDLEERTHTWLKYIQPAIFTIVGLFIMAIYFSIMMPLFQMMQGI
ncbi:competence type IV pilus assembly protein ComGB [Rossellomorea sp. YZS02]|uniref:competence type IV pilus assembly protein ComGB n=1 Tax=Rossellomorea sp. YZS02 TaxID=3097358 RepID=UPI002A16A2F4|nr:competence type IV pilus assembly protein ComGB [Rossellomorea sp. YZS02]MDX8344797.1 competence type IV pilus assembly protein ComGB [Rossellomorea sp. YZS02]